MFKLAVAAFLVCFAVSALAQDDFQYDDAEGQVTDFGKKKTIMYHLIQYEFVKFW